MTIEELQLENQRLKFINDTLFNYLDMIGENKRNRILYELEKYGYKPNKE